MRRAPRVSRSATSRRIARGVAPRARRRSRRRAGARTGPAVSAAWRLREALALRRTRASRRALRRRSPRRGRGGLIAAWSASYSGFGACSLRVAQEVPVQVDVALVDAAHAREAVRVHAVDEEHAGVLRQRERRQLLAEELVLDRAAGEALDAVDPRAHDEQPLGRLGPEVREVDRELLAARAARRDRAAVERGTARSRAAARKRRRASTKSAEKCPASAASLRVAHARISALGVSSASCSSVPSATSSCASSTAPPGARAGPRSASGARRTATSCCASTASRAARTGTSIRRAATQITEHAPDGRRARVDARRAAPRPRRATSRARAGSLDAPPAEQAAALADVERALRNPPFDFERGRRRAQAHEPRREVDEVPARTCCRSGSPTWTSPVAEPIRRVLQRAVDASDLGYPIHPGRRPTCRSSSPRARRERVRLGGSSRARVEVLTDVMQGVYVAHPAALGAGRRAWSCRRRSTRPSSAPCSSTGRTPSPRTRSRWARRGYELDLDALRARGRRGARMLLLCNPHNPTGRVLPRAPSSRRSRRSRSRTTWSWSADEIHADLVHPRRAHVPFASLSPGDRGAHDHAHLGVEGLQHRRACAARVAIFGSDELQRRFVALPRHVRGGIDILGFEATRAAWLHGEPVARGGASRYLRRATATSWRAFVRRAAARRRAPLRPRPPTSPGSTAARSASRRRPSASSSSGREVALSDGADASARRARASCASTSPPRAPSSPRRSSAWPKALAGALSASPGVAFRDGHDLRDAAAPLRRGARSSTPARCRRRRASWCPSMSPPPRRQPKREEPGLRLRHRAGRRAVERDVALPAVEPPRGRRDVEHGPRGRAHDPRHVLPAPPQALRPVAPSVQQHVAQRVPHLGRRPEHVEVVAVAEHRPAPLQRPVHGAREARGDRLHPSPERLRPVRLHEQMDVIVLDRVVDEPERPPVARLPERALPSKASRSGSGPAPAPATRAPRAPAPAAFRPRRVPPRTAIGRSSSTGAAAMASRIWRPSYRAEPRLGVRRLAAPDEAPRRQAELRREVRRAPAGTSGSSR